MKIKTIIQVLMVLLLGLVLTIQQSCKKDDKETTDYGTIPETTKIIDDATWQYNLESIDSSNFTFIFKEGLMDKVQLEIGDILVSSDGYGYLRKITNIVQEGSNIKVYTAFASLNEAVRDGNFILQTTLSEQKIQKITYYKQGIRIDTSHMKSTEATNIEATIDENIGPDGKIHISGNFSMLPSINCELEIKQFKVEKFSIDYTIEEQSNLETTLELLNVEFSEEVDLVNITFTPIIVNIGLGLPVVVVPEFEIVAGAELNIESNVTTSVSQQRNYTIGLLYEDETWSYVENISKSFTFELPTLTATANAKVYVKPQLKFKVYGTVSPYLYGQVYHRIEANPLTDPWWTLYGGANVGAGVKMDIFGQEIFHWPETPFNLFWYEEEIARELIFFSLPPENSNNAYTSTSGTDYFCYQSFHGITWPINSITFWGTNNISPFLINICMNDDYRPGTVVTSLTTVISGTYYGELKMADSITSYSIFEYTVDVPVTTLEAGWVGIQQQAYPPIPIFYWLNTHCGGDFPAMQINTTSGTTTTMESLADGQLQQGKSASPGLTSPRVASAFTRTRQMTICTSILRMD